VSGGTKTLPVKIKVSAVGGGGAVTGANIIDPGNYTASPANPVAVTGGYGAGATFTLNFGIGPITLTNKGAGYTSAPTVSVTGGGGTLGAVTANLTAVPSGGTAVATYSGRVWVASGRTVVFSAPASFSDFTEASAGGSFVMTDETLKSSITSLTAANNFLYIFGASSCNVVSDVSVSNDATVFSNVNISASIGTNQPYAVASYYRSLWFATPFGFYTLTGSTPQKASKELDGVFPLIDTATPFSAGTVVINEILCLVFFFKYTDKVKGLRTLMAVYFDRKWFFSNQGDTLKFIDTAIINGTPVLFGSDGTNLYKLFSNNSASDGHSFSTKLWDFGDALRDKQLLKVGIEIINPSLPQSFTVTVENENPGASTSISFDGGNEVQWINNLGNIVQWVNNLGQVVKWLSSGYIFQSSDASTFGKYVGLTIEGTSYQTTYSGVHLQYEPRETWGSGGAQ